MVNEDDKHEERPVAAFITSKRHSSVLENGSDHLPYVVSVEVTTVFTMKWIGLGCSSYTAQAV